MVFILEIIYKEFFSNVINVDEYSDIETQWIVFFVQTNNVAYFDSFGVEYIPKENNTFIDSKNIKTNIFRMQSYDSIMCGYFCIGVIDFILAGRSLTEFKNLFHEITLKEMVI